MRKLFTFLCAALMSVGMFATTVTWNNNDITGSGNSFTKDGVTITAGMIDFNDKNFMGGGTFSTTLGNFTKIEVTCEGCEATGTGWSGNFSKKTWAGTPASTVSFSGNFMGMGMGITIVCTIEEPAPTTYTLKLVADPTKGSVAVTNLLGSDIVDNGNGNYTVPENAEVTILATPLEGYEFSGWKAGDISCDFLDCGTALNTIDNPMTIGLVRDVALMAEFAAVAPAAKYYIVGSMNSWSVDENYEMNPSLEAETEEYFYTLDLTTTSEFKVVKVQNGQQSWIPEGMGNNYGQNGEITEDGEYTVYFRPNFDGGEDWFYSCIYAEKTGEFVPETPTYYLVGNMTEWDVNENYELNPNIDSDIEEYFYVLDLTTTNQFKVVKVQNGQQTWYPSGMDNNYGQNGEITEDGEYTIYFRPNYDGGDGWFYNCLYVTKNEPEPAPEWSEIAFVAPAAANDIDADAEFAVDGFKLTVTDPDNKMSIDENSCRFGTATDYTSYTHRLKTGGKSSSVKNFITLTIPSDGTLRLAVRTGSNNATDRNLIALQGSDTLYNEIIQESMAIRVMEGENEVSVYPYVEIEVAQGTVELMYPVNGLNFYSFAFLPAAEPEPTGVENVQTNQVQATKILRDGMLLIERDGKIYNVQGVEIK